MGLAVYNSIILDIHFPPICYRKLLSPAVVPYNMPKATVGVTKVTLKDLSQVFPVRRQHPCQNVELLSTIAVLKRFPFGELASL